MPFYQYIATDLRKKIIDGIYPKESRLPNQTELATIYNTSRVTIQKALKHLQIEGFIESRQGSGSFVKGPESVYDYDATSYGGMTKKLGHLGKLDSKIVSFEVTFPSEKDQEKLKLQKNDPVYDIIRLRILDEEPLALEYTVMPVLLIPGITEDILKHSVYQYIQEELRLNFGKSHRRIKADKPDQYDIDHLHCQADDPVLEIEQTVYLDNEIPFEYSQTRHRYDKGDITVINKFSKHIYHL
ncbi:GntR family transcriptional regulator [Enterococcus sp. CWB-B31]|uniref:GntR family transcriptional regulator n=1 Tax=Enterococcus sp. CWB-B31 TaxID=2885159 RepID=UPI001E645607|nr:GntR family transcriptional regulator [Enterococcus sp. CWB-B31]MCB5955744.1 GntR family transcriptional regulator [Enterococcus sp. CWB-B31]